MTTHKYRTQTTRTVSILVCLAAMSILAFGVWMRIAPDQFAEWANWPPHQHFLKDAGTFQVCIGLMMVASLIWRDALVITVSGFVLANSAHALNHFLDHAHGGNATDPWVLSVFSVIALVALVLHIRKSRQIRLEEAPE